MIEGYNGVVYLTIIVLGIISLTLLLFLIVSFRFIFLIKKSLSSIYKSFLNLNEHDLNDRLEQLEGF